MQYILFFISKITKTARLPPTNPIVLKYFLFKKTASLTYHQPINYKESSLISWSTSSFKCKPKDKKNPCCNKPLYPKSP